MPCGCWAWTRAPTGRASGPGSAWCPQLDNLDAELTVRQNLQIYGRYFGLPRAQVRAKATELLAFAQLTERADQPVEPLSGGMKRRLTIARSLVNDPELLLLDEPTTGLDPQARHLLWERLYRLKREGVTQIITTHYMDEAEQLCDRLVVMDGGLIVAEGSPGELIDRYSTREVLELRFAPEHRPAADALVPFVGAGRGAAGPAAALHRRRRARAGRAGRGGLPAAVRAGPALLAGGRVPAAHRPDAGGLMVATDPSFDRPGAVLRRGRAAVVEHYWVWYRRNWRATAVSSVLQPLLFLLAFGVGFGSLVDGTGRVVEATGGPLPGLARARAAGRVRGAERRVRVDLPGAVGLQVAAGLPRDDRRADHAGAGRARPPGLDHGQVGRVRR